MPRPDHPNVSPVMVPKTRSWPVSLPSLRVARGASDRTDDHAGRGFDVLVVDGAIGAALRDCIVRRDQAEART